MIFKHFRYFQSFKSVPKKSAENHAPYMKVQKWKETWDHVVPIIHYGRTWMPQILRFHENSNTLNMFFLDRCSAQQSHLKLSKWVTFNWCYAFYIFLKKGNDQKNRPKSTSPAFLLFHMAERGGKKSCDFMTFSTL